MRIQCSVNSEPPTPELFYETHSSILFRCCCSVAHSCPTLETQWTAACQAFLSFTISQSLLQLMSIESVMPSNHLILYRLLLLLPSVFPRIKSFPMSWFLASGGQRIGASASTSVLPVTIQDCVPLGLTGLILQPKDSQESFQNHSSKASLLQHSTFFNAGFQTLS